MFKAKGKGKQRTDHSAAARRRRKNKKKYTLYYFLLAFVAVTVFAVLSLTVLFKIETITIDGQARYTEEQLIKTAGVSLGDNLLRISTKAIKADLINNYPYIKEVNIKRKLPSSLTLTVTLTEPFATLETPQGSLLLDDAGRVLEAGLVESPPQFPRAVGLNLPQLTPGQYLPTELMPQYAQLLELIHLLTVQNIKVDVIDLTDRVALWMLYDGRAAVYLGGPSELEYKVRFLKTAIEQSLESNFVGIIDVSSRPTGRLRAKNIFKAENWPFPAYLLEDYERVIPKPAPPTPTPEEVPTSSSSDVSDTNSVPKAP